MNLIFIGPPGSGKSTVGRHLARRLQLPFVDSDQVIEARIGCSIRVFFEQQGESRFRDIEQDVLDTLTQTGDQVLSTGGGAVLRPLNRQHLRQRGRVIYLQSSPEELMYRLRHDSNRPLLQVADPMQTIKNLLAERNPLYREVAHLVVETGRPSVASLVKKIMQQLAIPAAAPSEPGLLTSPTR
ncbi:MAG: shikimate kinase [Rhodoferax sp.]|nr:shikimate kinase [Rhodoferax sp.]